MCLTRTAASLCLLGALFLAACGVVYTSPRATDSTAYGSGIAGLDVTVVPLTYASTAEANLTPYVPLRLPFGFNPGAFTAEFDPDKLTTPALAALPNPPTEPGMRPNVGSDNLPEPVAPRAYQIGLADVLLLSVDSSAALVDQLPALISAQSKRQGFIVQDDGAIAVPDAGRVRVAGLTMQDAEAAIFQALVSAGINPSFSLEISEFNSQRVSVGGMVRSPMLVPITLKPLYLHAAIDAAGGLTVEDARGASIRLFRNESVFHVSMERFQNDPVLREVLLRDGDAIFVVESFQEKLARLGFEEQIQIQQQKRLRAELGVQYLQSWSLQQAKVIQKLEYERQVFMDRLELDASTRDYAYLAGEVFKPQRFPLPFENKAVLANVLFGDEGFTINFADYGEIYVIQSSSVPSKGNKITAYQSDATNALNLTLASEFQIHSGDVLFDAEQPVKA